MGLTLQPHRDDFPPLDAAQSCAWPCKSYTGFLQTMQCSCKAPNQHPVCFCSALRMMAGLEHGIVAVTCVLRSKAAQEPSRRALKQHRPHDKLPVTAMAVRAWGKIHIRNFKLRWPMRKKNNLFLNLTKRKQIGQDVFRSFNTAKNKVKAQKKQDLNTGTGILIIFKYQ